VVREAATTGRVEGERAELVVLRKGFWVRLRATESLS
jgi:hypothetical protein